MAKSGRHRRDTGVGGAPTPRTRPLGLAPPPAELDPGTCQEPDLVVDVRHLLRVGGPLDLLATVSSMLSIVDPRTVYPFEHLRPQHDAVGAADELELETIMQSFLEVDVPESTALLAALAELAPDAEARARARAEVVRRSDVLPAWVTGLQTAEPYRAVLVSHVRGMAENVILGVRVPPRHEITVSVYIDHDEGTVVTDCVALPARLADVVVTLSSVIAELGTRFDDIDPADARGRITRAVDNGAAAYPPVETEDWPLFRPLVEWVARLIASGGPTGEVRGG
jgi:hypothetical protein